MTTRFLDLTVMAGVATVAAAAAVAVAAPGDAQGAIEQGHARPGGSYSELPGLSPEACAIACEADALCVSWTATIAPEPMCTLKAVAPAPIADSNAASGLSSRGPAFARLIAPEPLGPPQVLTSYLPPELEAQAAAGPAPPIAVRIVNETALGLAQESAEAVIAEPSEEAFAQLTLRERLPSDDTQGL